MQDAGRALLEDLPEAPFGEDPPARCQWNMRFLSQLSHHVPVKGLHNFFVEPGIVGLQRLDEQCCSRWLHGSVKIDTDIHASGGLPDTELLESGNELVVCARDIISGEVAPGAEVLLYDDGADHPGMQAAEIIAESGAQLEYVSPERQIAPDIGGTNLTPYMRQLLPQLMSQVFLHSSSFLDYF